MTKKLKQRFEKLEIECSLIEATKHSSQTRQGQLIFSDEKIDDEQFISWKVKVKNLLVLSCGKDSQYFSEFLKHERKVGARDTNLRAFKRLKSVFLAAKEDFHDGHIVSMHIVSIKRMVQAEVFDSELEQAEELLRSGYKLAAAVVAGTVLETALRDLCDQEGIQTGKLDRMNADIAKVGLYNRLQQKRITALADVRNSAAHGKPEAFDEKDVEMMIRDVENFISRYLV